MERVLAALEPEDREVWQSFLAKRAQKRWTYVYLLVSQPRMSGGRSLIGLTFTLQAGRSTDGTDVRPMIALRHTTAFMRERGGATGNLSAKHVAVLGCGSVGSEVADVLAASGVGTISLVDPEEFEIENVFRHALGRPAVGRYKAKALATELTQKYPGSTVHPYVSKARAWLASSAFRGVDTVVVAIGQPVLERAIGKQIRQSGTACGIVFAWLEPLGIGGHVVSVPSRGPGCLDCIYTDDEGQPSLYSRVTFLAPGQKVSRTLAGCTGRFVPYGALHSRKTALLASEMVLGTLDGVVEVEPKYAYWAGDARAARKDGLVTSTWHDSAREAPLVDVSSRLFERPCQSCRTHE